MLAIRQLPSLSMLHGLVAGKLMSGTGMHLEYIQCSFRSSVFEQYILYNKLCIVLCVTRFTLPENVALKCFEGLDLSKMDKVF